MKVGILVMLYCLLSGSVSLAGENTPYNSYLAVGQSGLPDYQAMGAKIIPKLPFVPPVLIRVLPDYNGNHKQLDFGALVAAGLFNIFVNNIADPETVSWRITFDILSVPEQKVNYRQNSSRALFISVEKKF